MGLKKPTIAQMKKRPSLWMFTSNNYNCIMIKYPDDSTEKYYLSQRWNTTHLNFTFKEFMGRKYEFMGWL